LRENSSAMTGSYTRKSAKSEKKRSSNGASRKEKRGSPRVIAIEMTYGFTYNVCIKLKHEDISIDSKYIYKTEAGAKGAAVRFLQKHPSIWNF